MYYDCPQENCILHVLTLIAKRMVLDLLRLAQKKSRCKEVPKRGSEEKKAMSFWKRALSRYILFVMQKVHFLELRSENKDNILYQLGYSAELSLELLLEVTEEDVLYSIPW